jgi:hypothetical protein
MQVIEFVGRTLGIHVLPYRIRASASKSAWQCRGGAVMMAIVSGLGAVVTAILAREVGEIPEGQSIDEAEAL